MDDRTESWPYQIGEIRDEDFEAIEQDYDAEDDCDWLHAMSESEEEYGDEEGGESENEEMTAEFATPQNEEQQQLALPPNVELRYNRLKAFNR